MHYGHELLIQNLIHILYEHSDLEVILFCYESIIIIGHVYHRHAVYTIGMYNNNESIILSMYTPE